MRVLRAFVRALGRGIMRAILRRGAMRLSSRLQTNRTMSSAGDMDDIADAVADSLDILEAVQFVADFALAVDDAREAAAAASVEAFLSIMESANRGQKVLIANYCIPYVEDYWLTTDNPDPDSFLSGLYSEHEAIEQALSGAAAMSYEAGRTAGLTVIQHYVAGFVGQAAMEGIMALRAWRRQQMESAWGEFVTWVRSSDDLGNALTMGVPMGALRRRGSQTMVIGDKYSSAGMNSWGATRQLSASQFMGASQPYWFTEGRRLSFAYMEGSISREQYNSAKATLYSRTYSNPWSTKRPTGYKPIGHSRYFG